MIEESIFAYYDCQNRPVIEAVITTKTTVLSYDYECDYEERKIEEEIDSSHLSNFKAKILWYCYENNTNNLFTQKKLLYV